MDHGLVTFLPCFAPLAPGSIDHDRVQGNQRVPAGATREGGDFNDQGCSEYLRTGAGNQFGGGQQGAAGREHVVDEQHARAWPGRIGLPFQPFAAVSERVVDAQPGRRQLAGLAQGDESAIERPRRSGAEDEPACLDGADALDALVAKRLDQPVARMGEGFGVCQQWRQILEAHAAPWKILDVAYPVPDHPAGSGFRAGAAGAARYDPMKIPSIESPTPSQSGRAVGRSNSSTSRTKESAGCSSSNRSE